MSRYFLLCLCLFAGAASAGDGAWLLALQARAAALDLAGDPAWRALLHYEDNWLRSGVHSTVVTPWFFLSEQGRSDPAAELRATLSALVNNRKIGPNKEPGQCAFPARYGFLNRRLQFDASRLPPIECEQYDQWLASLAPESVSLVFPSAYLNSPASMFGHTLLRINGERQVRSTELLAYAVNFAANTQEEKGIAFAYKGMTGGYPGVYGVFPYYEKVKQYAWIESRDVWSYELQLTPDEIRRLLAHLWEMRGVSFDYYFLTKNCSYQLLSLIQAARPSLRLVEQFDWYAIPADTIRALRNVPGLLGPAQFRPALRTRLAHEAGALSPEQRELALQVSRGELAPDSGALAALEKTARARVLEVAHDSIYYHYQTDEDIAREVALARARAVLLARSKIPVSAVFKPVPAPAVAPDAGHPTLRASVSGVWEDHEFSIGLRLRPAYHDLLDPPGGYTDGAQISFLDLGLRLNPDTGEARLDKLTLLEIVSLSPRNALFKPVSWRVDTGVRRRPASAVFADEPNNLGFFIEGGPGLTYGSLDSIAAYGLALGSADANSGFNPGYALGVGAALGVLARPARGWSLRAEIGGLDYLAGGEGRRRWAFVEQQIPLVANLALRLRAEYEDAAGQEIGRGVLTLQAYY